MVDWEEKMTIKNVTANTAYHFVMKQKPLPVAVIYSLVYMVVTFSAAQIYDLWEPTITHNGLSREYAAWINNYLFQPSTIYVYLWLPSAIESLFKSFLRNRVFLPGLKFRRVVEAYHGRANKPWLVKCFMVAALILMLAPYLAFTEGDTSLFENPPSPTWWIDAKEIYIFASPLIYFACFALISVIYRLIILQITLIELFLTIPISPRPINNDKAGGLGQLGKLLEHLAYYLFIVFLMFLASYLQAPKNFQNDYILKTVIPVYIVLALFLSIVPIFAPHIPMKTWKVNKLDDLFLQLDLAETREEGLEAVGGEAYIAAQNEVDHTEKKIERYVSYPEYPFDTRTGVKFLTLILLPLLQILLQSLDIFSK
jgi:hypothetical protein